MGIFMKNKTLFVSMTIMILSLLLSSCKTKDLGKLDKSVADEKCATIYFGQSIYPTKVDEKSINGSNFQHFIAHWGMSHIAFMYPKVIKVPEGYHKLSFIPLTTESSVKSMELSSTFEAEKSYIVTYDEGGLLSSTFTCKIVPYDEETAYQQGLLGLFKKK